jgi:hypothetical protein
MRIIAISSPELLALLSLKNESENTKSKEPNPKIFKILIISGEKLSLEDDMGEFLSINRLPVKLVCGERQKNHQIQNPFGSR